MHLGHELIAVSNQKASVIAGKDESILSDRQVNIAPLELSTEVKDSKLADTLGHYHHRSEIAAAYGKSSSRIIHHSNLFDEAQNLAKTKSLKELTAEARKEYELIHGNIVGVVGQAGIGKTTLTKLLAREVLNSNLFEAEALFYLRCRDINYKNSTNLLQFLTSNSEFANDLDKKDLTKLLTKLHKSNSICVIIDGLDESSLSEMSQPLPRTCSIHDVEKAETLIKHLLCGNLLPRAKKIFTSRPRQLYDLHASCRPSFIVNVLGLNEESQEKICKDICCNDGACAQVFKFVTDRLDLKSFCYVPANCIIVMYCLDASLRDNELTTFDEVDSITTILVATISHFIDNGLLRGENFQVKNLSFLACTSFKKNRIIFEQKDLRESNISKNLASTFLNARLGKKANLKLLGGIVTAKLYFSHLLFHEFFVAVAFIVFMNQEEFREEIFKFTSNKYEMVARFAFGLCNATTQEYLQELLPAEELRLSNYTVKKEMLKNFALEQFVSARSSADLFQVCGLVYELRDQDFAEDAASGLGSKLALPGDVFPSDIPAFRYVLQLRKAPMYLTVDKPNVKEGWMIPFLTALLDISQSGNIKVDDFTTLLGGPSNIPQKISFFHLVRIYCNAIIVKLLTDAKNFLGRT